jgi:hypothetical protein
MSNTTTGVDNTALGHSTMWNNISGSENTAIGTNALLNNTTGIQNIAIGINAGSQLTTGNNNIAIGNTGIAGDNATVRIGVNIARTFIDGIRGVQTGLGDAATVVIDSNGQLGTISSSRRYKEDISDMGSASDRLLQLHPVTFRYKDAYANGEQPLDYGLIAEEVAEVFPELVVFNRDNEPETVKYRLLSSLLLNELQKQNAELIQQNQVNEEQEAQLASIADQSAEINELKARVAELNQLVQQMAKLTLPATALVANNTGN